MYFRAADADTICAISTAPGIGGIAVIRVSGEQALALSRKICRFLPATPESHRVYYGHCAFEGEVLDEVLTTYFVEGRSFTGEETLEISCHGGQIVTANILKALVVSGCRLASRGEFTYRAFMNGRLDLVQAESVLSLIESRSKQAAKIALRQLEGSLSIELRGIEDQLLWLLAHLEASIDFSTEDITVVTPDELSKRCGELISQVQALVESYDAGRTLRQGLKVAILGLPNVGKSSLMNALVREERAIVTSQAGTTRDTVEGQISIQGLPVTFVDTAGLRMTSDEVEQLGIVRSRKAMEASDLIFFVLDGSATDWSMDLVEFPIEVRSKAKVVVNKLDLVPLEIREERLRLITAALCLETGEMIPVSASTREGLRHLEDLLADRVRNLESETSNVVTQARHLERLQKIHSCLLEAVGLIRGGASPEFIAFELGDAIRAMHELLGKEFNEQIIDRIFKEFCLGK